MDATIKAKWTAALRSGEFKQGRDTLHNPATGESCCLGVLCQIAEREGVVVALAHHTTTSFAAYDSDDDAHVDYLPYAVRQWAGLDSGRPEVEASNFFRTPLDQLNDDGVPFSDIADLIDASL